MNNNKTLLIVFLLLLAIFVGSKIFNRPKSQSFDKELIALDTARITAITISPKNNQPPIALNKSPDGWVVSSNGITAPAARQVVQSILGELVSIETKRIVGRSVNKWDAFAVTDSAGTRVKVLNNRNELADFYLGRFNFNQQTRQPLSYVRRADSDDTYAVEGFLGLSFDQSFDNFRDKSLVKIPREEIRNMLLKYTDDQEINMLLANGAWTANGVEIDSASIADYITRLSQAKGSTFAPSTPNVSETLATLVINPDTNDPPTLALYVADDSDRPFVLHSSQNVSAYFASDSSGVFKTVFRDLFDLVKI